MTTDVVRYSLNEYISRILASKEQSQKGMIEIGRLLLIVAETEAYKEQFETFSEFLGSPEISFSRASAFKMMAIAEWMRKMNIEYEEIKGIDMDKLYKINRLPGEVYENIEMARTLSRSDLTAEVRRLRGLPELAEEATVPEIVKSFLYDYLPKKKVAPAGLELEDLLGRFCKFMKNKL